LTSMRTRLSAVPAVALGGALGGSARYGVDLLLPSGPTSFPQATFAVNVTGAFLLALLLVLVLEVWPPVRHVRPFVAVGLLGSLTTFSTWMVELDQMLAEGATLLALSYLAGTVLAGVAATVLGLLVGRRVAARRTHGR
jgi:fluoride exporter